MWSAGGKKKDDSDDSDDSSSEEEDSDESDDEAGPSNTTAEDVSREDRKKEKKARKDAAIARAKAAAIQVGDLPPSESEEEDDDMPANPNHSKAARKQLLAPTEEEEVDKAAAGVAKMTVKQPQSRREREALQKAQNKAKYDKLHAEGKTDQAQADLGRLKLIREARELDRARKEVCDAPYQLLSQLSTADQVRVSRPSVRKERSRTRHAVPRSRPRRPRSARQPSDRPRRVARSRSRITASTKYGKVGRTEEGPRRVGKWIRRRLLLCLWQMSVVFFCSLRGAISIGTFIYFQNSISQNKNCAI